MKLTENLRLQHKELVILSMQIGQRLEEAELTKDAREVRELLSEMAGKLRVHLAMEDASLYPRLLGHADERIRSASRRFLDELGGLKERFFAYLKRWPSASAIQGRAAAFIAETQEIFLALYQRMERENKELHPMADQLGQAG